MHTINIACYCEQPLSNPFWYTHISCHIHSIFALFSCLIVLYQINLALIVPKNINRVHFGKNVSYIISFRIFQTIRINLIVCVSINYKQMICYSNAILNIENLVEFKLLEDMVCAWSIVFLPVQIVLRSWAVKMFNPKKQNMALYHFINIFDY